MLPTPKYLQQDDDLDFVRNYEWFDTFLVENSKASENILGTSFLERSVTLSCIVEHLQHQSLLQVQQEVIPQDPPQHLPSPQLQQQFTRPSTEVTQVRYTDDDELNDAITYDEDLNKLQASLLREGLSMRTVTGMILEVGLAKHQVVAFEKKIDENRRRLNERLSNAGMKEKCPIPGDGNCQFYSLSDQLYDTIDRSAEIRHRVVEWLRVNKDWELSNGAVLWNFACDQPWDLFCDELSRDGIWGNHLTLFAASEIYGVSIQVISSVEGSNYITDINPTVVRNYKKMLLSHCAEEHYGSLTFA
eukprot:TRINITY_DN4615_c0_g1_i4.p1 TRINITY_DN4615_c0_g1~~TRINITY_DN4615_c0_g1_i4.p1  ORF type:complete len:303 (-),score=66.02 TRINITY_DN4615_c0_g1_i4:48-956(-)